MNKNKLKFKYKILKEITINLKQADTMSYYLKHQVSSQFGETLKFNKQTSTF